MAIRAVILIKVTPRMLKTVLSQIERIKLVHRFATITGEYDILLEVEASRMEELHDIVLDKLDPIKGIEETNTHIVLKDLRVE
ncbi:MAG: Lrp/AsnC ligand binding domain-containing protein [Promethearchaeati archaeon SRVP18_Atabeyarchaeia-1]